MWQNPDDVDCFKMKKEFVFFKEYHEAIKCMSLKDQTVIIKEVLEYMFEGIMPPVHNDIKGVFWAGNYRDLRLSKTRASAKSNATQTNIKSTSNEHQINIKRTSKQNQSVQSMTYDKDKDKEKRESKEKRSATASPVVRFIKPTVEQIKAYISERGYHFDAEAFFAFYESKGWKVGNSPMKSWEAACVTWEKREPHPEEPVEKEEYHPLEPFTKCPVCGGKHVSHRNGNGMCEDCGIHFAWSYSSGVWKEEA